MSCSEKRLAAAVVALCAFFGVMPTRLPSVSASDGLPGDANRVATDRVTAQQRWRRFVREYGGSHPAVAEAGRRFSEVRKKVRAVLEGKEVQDCLRLGEGISGYGGVVPATVFRTVR